MNRIALFEIPNTSLRILEKGDCTEINAGMVQKNDNIGPLWRIIGIKHDSSFCLYQGHSQGQRNFTG